MNLSPCLSDFGLDWFGKQGDTVRREKFLLFKGEKGIVAGEIFGDGEVVDRKDLP